MVKTSKVKARRRLRFETPAEMLAEARRLADSQREGTLTALGNWTLGQALGHIAFWIDAGYDGYPPMKRPAAPRRLLLRMLRGKMLRDGFPAGVRLPGAPEGTYGTQDLPTDQALTKLTLAAQRLERSAPTHASPAFGSVTHEQAKAANLRHAELHLGFFIP